MSPLPGIVVLGNLIAIGSGHPCRQEDLGRIYRIRDMRAQRYTGAGHLETLAALADRTTAKSCRHATAIGMGSNPAG